MTSSSRGTTRAAGGPPSFKQGKEDVGFRDAVIFLSVVDDLMAAKGDVGALVTRARAGVELQVFRSVKDVFDSLVRAAADYTKDQWIAMTARVQNSLQSRLKEIEKFVVEMLEIPEWGLVHVAPASSLSLGSRRSPLRALEFRIRSKFARSNV